jgi:hypothetical protein
MGQVAVDFVAREDDLSTWRMVLVEQGPWPTSAVKDQLTRIQDRLYTCIDAALDGALAQKYPDSRGKRLIIQLDGYDLPESQVRDFFTRFSSGVMKVPSYVSAFAAQAFVTQIGFELTLREGMDA